MLRDLAHSLTAEETLELCGLDAALSAPRSGADADAWLKGLLETLAGRRSYDSTIEHLLKAGQESEALTLAARAIEKRRALSASVHASLESVWLRWLSEYRGGQDRHRGPPQSYAEQGWRI